MKRRLVTIEPSALPRQAHAHPREWAAINLLRNFRPAGTSGFGSPKPAVGTGLWTGTLFSDGTTSWTRWLEEEEWGHEYWQELIEVIPAQDARVLLIDFYSDLQELVWAYPDTHASGDFSGENQSIDWRRVSEEFDAVYLTEAGEERTRYTRPLNLNGWDCECVLWLNQAFTLGARTTIKAKSLVE